MKNISEIDSNFKTGRILADDMVSHDCFEEPFEINGLYRPRENKNFLRLPEEYQESDILSDGVKRLMRHTSGGRIRFSTNSPYLAVAVELSSVSRMMHMPSSGQSGVDLYTCQRGTDDYVFRKIFLPYDMVAETDKYYEGFYEFTREDEFKEHEVMLHLPLYNGVKRIHIGVKEGCRIFSPIPYKIEKPVIFYGSSITQGGCASRPGNVYINHLSRWLCCDFINLGFSGSAKGENELAEFIARQEMSAFVLDYDANAPTAEHLRETHYAFYETIRKAHKKLPVLMISMPRYPKRHMIPDLAGNRGRDLVDSNQVIMESYLRGRQSGDENLYYIDGESLFGGEEQDACTVDFLHPNDLGFFRMAKTIYPVLKKALK